HRNHTNKIQINNIPNHAQWDEINRLLATFGNVQQCDQGAATSENSFSVSVTYDTPDQAQQAFAQLNGFEFEDTVLKVDFIMDQGRGTRGGRTNKGPFRPFPYSGNSPNPMRPTDFPLRILVLSDMVGAIIGRAGNTIRQITQQSRARVDVHRKENAGSLEKVKTKIVEVGRDTVTLVEVGSDTVTLVEVGSDTVTLVEVGSDTVTLVEAVSDTVTHENPLKILAHNNLIGRIIGKNGNTIKGIMEKTDTKITVSSSIHDVNSFNMERIITVVGKLENVCKAEQMISTKLRQSYENDLSAMAPQAFMFPGVHPMAMMSTMGAPGYPPAPRGGPSTPPYGIYNSSPSYMPVNYPPGPPPPSQHHDPNKEQVFLYIPNAAVGAIIGTGGSSIRDMISSSGASIKASLSCCCEGTFNI
ncbi:insulin-like growth factor 2 mRNA-binding protein 1, partial [Limulus polyphemus]|uniref:Insulin-like growth factor 2 mRNA-binding protein 1 n=1 Tax=Limulus polyphemus TaxID=6850 RepID=A0ABM1TRU3_LIMPO